MMTQIGYEMQLVVQQTNHPPRVRTVFILSGKSLASVLYRGSLGLFDSLPFQTIESLTEIL
jgi:hypothetical protein